jgi:hypothetical protein
MKTLFKKTVGARHSFARARQNLLMPLRRRLPGAIVERVPSELKRSRKTKAIVLAARQVVRRFALALVSRKRARPKPSRRHGGKENLVYH